MVHFFGAVILAFAILGLGAAPGSSSASAQEVFTIADLKVDAAAETAAAAREKALAAGERLALRRLFERLTLKTDYGRLPSLDRSQIAEVVKGFEVEEERTSRGRYLATLKFHFKPKAVRRRLRDSDIRFAETLSKPVLILPIYEMAGALALWDDPNPWRDVFSRLEKRDSLVPLVVPLGDILDIADIGAEQAVRGDDTRLSAIARRYGAADTLVALASYGSAASGNLPGLRVNVSRFGAVAQGRTFVESFTAEPDEEIEALLLRAARSVTIQVEENWKHDNLLRFDREGSLTVAVPIRRLEDWIDVKKRLGRVAFIRRSDLVYLSRDEARAVLRYIGDEEQLTLALAQNDLLLSRGAISWILKLGVAEGSGVAQPRPVTP
jgi:hypothetical protein